jgi:hypothetical protein
MVQCCQDFVNPGNKQAVALQIINLSPNPVELDSSLAICQLIIFKLTSAAEKGYTNNPKSKYAHETVLIPSRMYTESDKKDDAKPRRADLRKMLRLWMQKWIRPIIPSLLVGTFITPFVYNGVKDRPVSEIFTIIWELPMSVPIGIGVSLLYIWLVGGDKRK